MTTPASTLSRCFLFLALSLAPACDADLGELGDDTDGSSETNDGESDGAEGGGFEPCSSSNPCGDGLFCFNGLCALGCTNNDNCADDQYCDTSSLLCQNNEVPSCQGNGDCFGEQLCLEGLCSTPPTSTTCTPNGSPDGCDSNAICFEDDVAACYTMPACGEDGSCPVGFGGAVCNDGYLPEKDRICLLGGCETAAHCPDDWVCTKPGGSVLGVCGDGGLGSPCTDASECNSGVCNNPLGLLGICS